MIPGYPAVMENVSRGLRLADVTVLGQGASLLSASSNGLELLIVDCPSLFYRQGGPYVDEFGNDHPDNWLRFALLSHIAAQVADGLLPGWRPDVVHAHDWQAALTPVYLKAAGSSVPSVLTIHNLAFQGQFPAAIFGSLDLPAEFFSTGMGEYYGDFCYLKAGINCADALTTVSPTYAREILSEDLGMGLGGVLANRQSSLRGVVNGIDMEVWNPATDPYIPENFNDWTLFKRRANREALTERFRLEQRDGPIFAICSRLTWQKGVDLVEPIAEGLIDLGARLVIHGQGERAVTEGVCRLAERYPGRISVEVGYDEALAHLIHAGADSVIQPSRFEPCGLTQLYALRYGAPPIVARTGGLAETIIDANDAAIAAGAATGFQFKAGSVEDFYHAIERAVRTFSEGALWQNLQIQGMKTDFSWSRSAGHYATLYEELAARRRYEPRPRIRTVIRRRKENPFRLRPGDDQQAQEGTRSTRQAL